MQAVGIFLCSVNRNSRRFYGLADTGTIGPDSGNPKGDLMSQYIAVEGVIGVGKTTLARYFKETTGGALILERFDENPFLSDFYADRDKFAFQTQIFFLLSRYRQQQEMRNIPRPIVTDYIFAKDHLFAKLNLQGDEFDTYLGVYKALAEKVFKPDLVVYLRADTSTLMNRIALRDRPYERNMDEQYIEALRVAYEDFFDDYRHTPLLVLDTDDIDIVTNLDQRQAMIDQIQGKLLEEPVGELELFDPAIMPLEESRRQLPDFQQFHRFLDQEKGFSEDLLLNTVALQEEVGELSKAILNHWKGLQLGNPNQSIADIGDELADIMAYLLKLANYTGIDLEAAYLEKMEINRRRTWK
jgi:deoxyguanosine kinase